MATFRPKGNGIEVAVCVNGVRRSKVFSNKTKAKSWASEMEQQLSMLGEGVDITYALSDLYQRYAKEVSEYKRGVRWEIVRLNAFQQYPIAKVKLIDLRREHIEAWISERHNTVSGSSINRELNLVSACLTQARRWRLMSHNPMEDLKRPKNPPARDRRISEMELRKILNALKYAEDIEVSLQKQRVAVACLFAIETAMRASEICSLHLRHINVDTRVATLEKTKNGDMRKVALTPQAIRLLEQLKPWKDSQPLFRLKSEVLSSTFRKGVREAGIENLHFHDTRHEAITRLSRKLDVLALARMVGHKDIRQLQTYYNESAEDLAKRLDS